MTEQPTDPGATGELEGLPCVVSHEDAGGQCWRPEAMEVHGLPFCEVHGPEARIGALSEAAHDAEQFFERFRYPYARPLSPMVVSGVEAALEHVCSLSFRESEAGDSYEEALKRAYPNPPEAVRQMVENWQEEEEPGRVYDELSGVLNTLHKMMRVAHEDGRTWLVEMLEYERENQAVQARVALEEHPARRG
jgi:hypothetical protein